MITQNMQSCQKLRNIDAGAFICLTPYIMTIHIDCKKIAAYLFLGKIELYLYHHISGKIHLLQTSFSLN